MRSAKILLLFMILVTSCKPGTAVPTSTQQAAKTATPASTSTSIPMIRIEDQEIPDPHFSNPDLFDLEKANSPVPQLVRALGMAGVDATVKDISEGLTYQRMTAKNGEAVFVTITSDNPATSFNEGNIPLLIFKSDPASKEYSWTPAYLKDVAGLHNILVGTVIDGFERLNDIDSKLFDLNFNMVTMSWTSVDVPFDQMEQMQDYRLIEIIQKNLEEIMWFHLGDIPLHDQEFNSKEEAVAFANAEIDKIVNRYIDSITIVTIFNEVNPGTTDPVYPLWKEYGDDFMIEVYRHAREILPGRKIIVNNGFNDHKNLDGSTYTYTFDLTSLLKTEGLIDAVGMEMHQAQSSYGVDNPLVVEEAVDVMRSFGLPVYVTELDVNQTYLLGTDHEKRIQQAGIYEDVVRACVRSEVCEMINFWVTTDQSSWYEFALGEPNANAGIFEDDGTPKIAYYTVLRGLLEGY